VQKKLDFAEMPKRLDFAAGPIKKLLYIFCKD
jgi:hypothetical protein